MGLGLEDLRLHELRATLLKKKMAVDVNSGSDLSSGS